MGYILEQETTLEQVFALALDMELSLEELAGLLDGYDGGMTVKPAELAALLRVVGNTAHIIVTKARYLNEQAMRDGRATA